MRYGTSCAVAALMVFSAPMAFAQSLDDTIELDPITVTGDQEPSDATVLSQEDIRIKAPLDTKDLFAGESTVTNGGVTPSAQRIHVQGIEESRLNVQIDGTKQPNGPFHHSGGSLVDTSLLKQVTIKPGVAAADDGPNALGGAIQFETLDARDLLEEGDDFGGRVSLGYDSNGQNRRGSLTLFGRTGGFEYVLNGQAVRGDDYKDGDGNTVAGTAAGLDNYLAKLAYTTQDGKRFEFSANKSEDDALRTTRPDFLGFPGSPISVGQFRYTRESYIFSYKDEAPVSWFAPEVVLGYSEISLDHSFWNFTGETTSLNGKIQNTFDISGGSLVAGLDFYHDTASTPSSTAGEPDYAEEARNFGIFAQARQDVTSRLYLSYGLRADFQTIERTDGTPVDGETDTQGLSANISADYALSDTLTLEAGAASVFGGISGSEAVTLAAADSASAILYSTLRSARSNNLRIGLSYDNGPWQASGALFHTEMKDVSSLRANNTSRSDYFDLTAQGLDAALRYSNGLADIGLTYTYAKVESNGEPTSTSYYTASPTGHIFGLNATYEISDAWTVGGLATVVLENDDIAGSPPIPGYQVVNVFAAYRPQAVEGLTLRFGIDNLLDETYANRNNSFAGSSTILPFNDPGRNFSILASLEF